MKTKKLQEFYKTAALFKAYGGAWGSHCEWLFGLELRQGLK